MFSFSSRLGFCFALATLLVSSAQAAAIAGADFETPAYAAGTLPGQTNWTGASAWLVGAGGLSSGTAAGGGQHAQITGSASVGTNGEIARLSFPEQSGTVYARFNFRYEGTSDPADFFWAALGKSGGTNPYDASLGLVLRNETGGWGLQARARDASTSVNGPVPSRAFSFYTTMTVLLKAEKSGANGANYDRISLWVNPAVAPDSTEAAVGTPDATVTRSTGRTGIDQLFFRVGDAGALDVGERILIDAIQVGSTWADVTSANSGANLAVTSDSFSARPATASGADDFDGDGQPGLLELALGSAPEVAATVIAPVFSSVEIADNALDVTYERAATVGRFVPVVESSVDLVSWTEANVNQSYLEQVLPGGRVQVTARIQPRAVRQFARLRARDIQQMDTLTPDTTRDLFARLLLNWGTKVNTAGTRDTYGSTYSYEWVTRMVTPMAAWLSQPGRPGTLSVGASTVNVAETLRRALVNGTDPAETTRWPFPANQADQIVVEAQQPAFAAWLLHDATNRSGAPGAAVWSGFTAAQRSNLASFLSATGSPSFSYTNNWNLFVTINQEARKRLALAGVSEFSGYSQSAINTGLEKIQAMHRGGGWYADS
ncbi:MAG: DUF2264 domain-containing protein, partial [Opitutaceae bacterium]|nr:DUF2264 domain-containing protein [Opitutaceae bacterium]